VEHEITVELKNEVQIRGTLKSVDQYLNIKLDNAEAVDEIRWPHLVRYNIYANTLRARRKIDTRKREGYAQPKKTKQVLEKKHN
jgi:small nuclear ribonucleoprotein (snRNP)-like protein